MYQSSEAKTVQITPIKVAVINASDHLRRLHGQENDKYIENVVQALQKQVDEHFAPAWGITAKLDFIGGDSARKCADMIKSCSWAKEAWWLVLLDNSDIAWFTGYHDVTTERMPIGKVFVETNSQSRREWTTSASHELLEMLADPGMNLTVFKPTDKASEQSATGQLYAYEVCDPCDADQYSIEVNGQHISVSNFVYPAWFEWFQKRNITQFDHKGSPNMNEPFKLLPGGFINVLDIPYGTGWRQISEDPGYDMRYRLRPLVGSRRERRILGGGWRGGGDIPSG